jgi:hypothetical protein
MNAHLPNYATLLIILPSLLLLISGFFFFPPYTGLARGKAYLALIASVLACGITTLVKLKRTMLMAGFDNRLEFALAGVAAGAVIVFLTAFALRLWGRWVGDKATSDEQQPGLVGIRAWFSVSNVMMAVAIVLCTWFGFGVSPLLTAVIVTALLAANPVLRMEAGPRSSVPVADDLSTEREKIISMLEAGKLTPDESAELLEALGQTSRAHQPVKLTSSQRLMLIGAALVVIGFFLPWFVFNPGKIASSMMMNVAVESPFVGSDFRLVTPKMNTPNVSISGGDIQKGLGWMALLLAGAAALIPYLSTRLDEATLRTIRVLCLGVGTLIVLYLLTNNIRFVGIGLIIAVGGYLLEIVGVIRESRTARTGM